MKTAKYFVHTWTLYEVSRIEAWTTADITWYSLSKTNFSTLSLSTAFSLFLVSFVWPSTYRAQYIIDSAIIAATARKYVFSLYLAGHMTRLSDPIDNTGWYHSCVKLKNEFANSSPAKTFSGYNDLQALKAIEEESRGYPSKKRN